MKLAIFDLDGTLVDSLGDLADACNNGLRKFGYPVHELEKYRYFVGDGVLKLVERILPEEKRSEESIAALKAEFDSYYNVHYADKTHPYDGIVSLLDKLAERGVKLAVASNKPDEFTKAVVKVFFEGKFDMVVGKCPDTEKKPAPDILLKIMDALDVSADETVMIGDTNVDIRTAKNAGVSSIGCLWGFRTMEELEQAGADHIVSSPNEILKYI